MSVFGVDFGTLNSTIALTRNGGVDVVLNEVSKRETSAFVSLGNEERYLGESGLDKAVRNAASTVGSIKRFIGLRADDPQVEKELRFFFGNTTADDEGRLMFELNYNGETKNYYPEQVLAMYLGQLSKYVDREAIIDGAPPGSHVKDCVLTVPCYYTAEQRKLVIQSAEIAGLNCMALINETSAAGIDYGIFRGSSLPEKEEEAQIVSIVDLGYSCATVTLATFWKGNMKVLAHVSDAGVGTRELDYYLTQHFGKEIKSKYKIDVNENKRARVRILQACEKLKTLLSGNNTAPFNIENLMDIDVNIAGFTREDMETACTEVYERLESLIKDGVKAAGIELSQIHKVEVIGGGCRIPKFKKVVEEAFGQPGSYTLNATESVARGTAITAAVYSPKFRVREYVVHEAPTRNILLGYKSDNASAVSSVACLPEVNKVVTILNKTDKYPKTIELTFDRKEEFDLYMFYDEEKSEDLIKAKQPVILSKTTIGTTNKNTNGKVKVEIKFHPSGLATIELASTTEEYEVEEIEEKKAEKEGQPAEQITVKKQKTRRVLLTTSPADILAHKASVVVAARKTEVDMAARDTSIIRTKETKNALESYIYDYRGALSEGGQYYKYANKDDSKKFVDLANTYESWLYDDEYELVEYEKRLKELQDIGQPALRRFRLADEIPFALTQFLKKMDDIKLVAADRKGTAAWISDEELNEVIAKVAEAVATAKNQVEQYKASDLSVDPTLTPTSFDSVVLTVDAAVKAVVNKPAPPAPKKEEEEKPAEEGEEKKEGDETPAAPKVDKELD